jgi:hypothetical protein
LRKLIFFDGLLQAGDRTSDATSSDDRREYAFAEVESGHSAAFLANGRCAVESAGA